MFNLKILILSAYTFANQKKKPKGRKFFLQKFKNALKFRDKDLYLSENLLKRISLLKRRSL